MKHEFICSICKKEKVHESEFTTGYAVDDQENKICFDCCGYEDKAYMILNGRNTLYLTKGNDLPEGETKARVSNWPGTAKFTVKHGWRGKHNIARVRYDVWFDGPDGFVWHGVQYGDNTQICHCKRTKEKSR